MEMDVRGQRVHFVGIGGAGLSAIARVLMEQGAVVTGSDLVLSPAAEALARDGARVYVGHQAGQVDGADWVVVSSAVPEDNVEVLAAREAGIPVVRRAQVLGEMMEGRVGVAVAGTHGKTTTTAMVASILWEAGLDPTFIVGGVMVGLGTNGRAGTGPHFVVEADEYDRTFLELRPRVAVVTNVEHDHPDCYPNFAHFRAAFADFVALLPPDGLLVTCRDDRVALELGAARAARGWPVVSYGLTGEPTWTARELHPNPSGGMDFVVVRAGQALGEVRLRVPGSHNVLNGLAALAVTVHLGVPFPTARSALEEFRGVGRRFEVKGEADGVTVVDDYAHHPTEIRATLAAARQRFPGRPLWAVWQPHTYSRTQALLEGFARAFGRADHVLVLPIYAAREEDRLGVSSADVVAAMAHPDARLVGSREEAVVVLGTEVRPGDVVLTLGAGDGDRVGEWLLAVLREGEEETDAE
ncbi:MAG TPA: UDP-N-acetylmuramate--L-alanine ligase [Anaerolineales bacterium]|nr:UDP-N-acetylmuramate--L-alanine ligase [Anaerolineae bacterium]HIQ01185.1 UDP-N-acetylmuramate--L-alanine ligase [Anaerolineales bacterium]